MMIEISRDGARFSIPDAEEREGFLRHAENLFAQAIQHTDECCEILVQRYGANRDWIDPGQFYYGHTGDQIENIISGRPIKSPEERVERAVEIILPQYLGLVEPGLYAAAIRKSQEEYRQNLSRYQPVQRGIV
jgi:hypothetical protein